MSPVRVFASFALGSLSFVALTHAQNRDVPRPHPTTSASTTASAPPIVPIPGNMVTVSGATFTMGTTAGDPDEAPAHAVTVATFQMDVTEVTVGAYKACVTASACTEATEDKDGAQDVCTWSRHRLDLPITCVSFAQAEAFCKWAQKRLPTEDEWELAARGTDGRLYPWGTNAPTSEPCWSTVRVNNQTQRVCAAGSHPGDRSPFGVLDLGANVQEWTASPWCDYATHRCQAAGLYRVKRGGDHNATTLSQARVTQRVMTAVTWGYQDVGFRCAKAP